MSHHITAADELAQLEALEAETFSSLDAAGYIERAQRLMELALEKCGAMMAGLTDDDEQRSQQVVQELERIQRACQRLQEKCLALMDCLTLGEKKELHPRLIAPQEAEGKPKT